MLTAVISDTPAPAPATRVANGAVAGITITTRYLHPVVADLGTIMDARNQERHVLGHSAETMH
jgi:hypothetical protein